MKLYSHEQLAFCSFTSLQRKYFSSRFAAKFQCSEKNEDLLDVTFNVLDLLTDHVETDGLGEGSALTDGNNISNTKTECG